MRMISFALNPDLIAHTEVIKVFDIQKLESDKLMRITDFLWIIDCQKPFPAPFLPVTHKKPPEIQYFHPHTTKCHIGRSQAFCDLKNPVKTTKDIQCHRSQKFLGVILGPRNFPQPLTA